MAFESVAWLVGVIPRWVCGGRIRMHVFISSIGDRFGIDDDINIGLCFCERKDATKAVRRYRCEGRLERHQMPLCLAESHNF